MVTFVICKLLISVLKAWSLDQQHEHQLEACEKLKFSRLKQSETSGVGPVICGFTSIHQMILMYRSLQINGLNKTNEPTYHSKGEEG